VDELASDISQTGALKIEGPEYAGPGYYAVYFEDPLGNALEICYREKKMSNCGVRRQGDAA
jgi:predicted lactoylglutathione lyase